MKTLLIRSRWLLLLPLAAAVGFVVQLNVVNRVSDFLDEQRIEAFIHKKVREAITGKPASVSPRKTETRPPAVKEDLPVTMPGEKDRSKGLSPMILHIHF